MQFRTLAAASALLIGLSLQAARAQDADPKATLHVGDPAPKLAFGEFVKGDAVRTIEPGKLYVVEFWATWCGPCRASIPHLSEMAKKFADVTFVGSDCFEEDETLVKPFVTEMGDKMAYHVALDDKKTESKGAMAKTWMDAAGQNGIPTAFLIGKDSKIVWIGHPMELEPVLDQVVKGTYDPKVFAASEEKAKAAAEKLSAAVKAKDVDAVPKLADELAAAKPSMADSIAVFTYSFLAKNGHAVDARPRAAKLIADLKDTQMLNDLAYTISGIPTPAPEDIALARQAVDKAVTLGGDKSADIIDTSARVSALEKNWSRAVELEQKALNLADADEKAALQKTLEAYQKQQLPAAE